MNPLELTSTVPPADDVESTSLEEFDSSRQAVPGAPGHARLRYLLLIVIALLSGWLAFTIQDSIREIEAEVEMIRANLVSSSP